MNKNRWILGSMAALVGLGCAVAQVENEAEKSAVSASLAWLELVDQAEYQESWSEAASLFKNAVDESTWVKQISAARQPLGKTLSRRVKSTKYMTSVPGAPDGQYVVIQTEASFENKKSAVETITPMLDSDGKWRVSGYYIK